MKRLFKSKKAGCVGWKIMTLLLALLFAGFITSCSSDEDETIPSEEKVLTKHITMNVNSDSIRTTRVGNQSRFGVYLPENGHGYLSYYFQKGDTLHALTKINGKYHDSPLICTKVSNDDIYQSNNATFEGEIQYSEANKTVYLFLGHYLALGNNLLYLGDSYKIFDYNSYPPYNWIPNAPWLYLYGKSYIEDSLSTLSASLNMLTSFITVKVPDKIIDELSDQEYVSCELWCIKNEQYKMGFPEGDIFFNIETAKIEATSYYSALGNVASADKSRLSNNNGIINIPLLPGNYRACTCMVSYGGGKLAK